MCDAWKSLTKGITLWVSNGERLSIKYQSGQLLLCWHPGAGAIWNSHFLVINHARFSRIQSSCACLQQWLELVTPIFTIWTTLFVKFSLVGRHTAFRNGWWWKATQRHTVWDTQSGSFQAKFSKHTLHEYIGNCEEWSQWIARWAVVSVETC